MNSILTTYVKHDVAAEIAQEAERLGLSRSEWIARIISDKASRNKAARAVKREQIKTEAASAK
jgi:hypothetical protein